MARKLKITVTTALNLVVVQDYNNATGEIYQIKNGGFGEYTMEQSGNVDLTEDSARITLVPKVGEPFGSARFADFESITINGAAASISDLETVRAVLAPYFFNSGGGGYSFYKEVTITAAQLKSDLAFVAPLGGIELLPAVANTYYNFRCNHELHFGTIPFGVSSAPTIYSHVVGAASPTSLVVLPVSALIFSSDRIVADIIPQMTSSTLMPIYGAGERIIYKLANNAAQTNGDGHVVMKIWYTPIIFG